MLLIINSRSVSGGCSTRRGAGASRTSLLSLGSDSRETVFVAGDQSGVRAARDDGATDRAVLA
ncbi:hypothetical protein AB0D12_34280 [Streptomyces sp. NPDC048479]|uniref:hypothetical protein n=1 Tax=Streptomyces sp. NPDC048479 TaxID=3154725 RepID=UPI00341A011F